MNKEFFFLEYQDTEIPCYQFLHHNFNNNALAFHEIPATSVHVTQWLSVKMVIKLSSKMAGFALWLSFTCVHVRLSTPYIWNNSIAP